MSFQLQINVQYIYKRFSYIISWEKKNLHRTIWMYWFNWSNKNMNFIYSLYFHVHAFIYNNLLLWSCDFNFKANNNFKFVYKIHSNTKNLDNHSFFCKFGNVGQMCTSHIIQMHGNSLFHHKTVCIYYKLQTICKLNRNRT